ncbi:Nucleoprotein TPR, partial [Bienertia sinuspersici]
MGGYGSYLVPAIAVGAMGYCYMWWKIASASCQNDVPSTFVVNDLSYLLSSSYVMFNTKQNMENDVASVSKQLDSLNDALATTNKHLSKRLETLDWKLEEKKEISGQILNDLCSSHAGRRMHVRPLDATITVFSNYLILVPSGSWKLRNLIKVTNAHASLLFVVSLISSNVEVSNGLVFSFTCGLQSIMDFLNPVDFEEISLMRLETAFGCRSEEPFLLTAQA